MQSFIQWWDQKTGAAVLLLALLLSAGACGPKSPDRSGRTAVVLDLRQAVDQSAGLSEPLVSNQAASGVRMMGMLKITASDLTEPVIFFLPDLQMGSVQQLWVPSGPRRTFELWIYEIPPTSVTPDTFPATLFVTLTPRELRTLDLTGEEVNLQLVMGAESNLAQVGTYNNDGYIEMDRASRVERVPGNCRIILSATLIDPEFNSLRLGPFPLHVGLDPNFLDGEYLISEVPAGREFKLALENPFVGWSGESDQTLVSSTLNPNPINVLLSGLLPLTLTPANGMVGNGLVGDTVKFQAAGGYGSYNFTTALENYSEGADVSISDTGLYRTEGIIGGDTVDAVTVSDTCSPTDQATAQVYWFTAPILLGGFSVPAISPASGYYTGGDSISINGQGFDTTTQVFFGSNQATTTTLLGFYQMQAVNPAGNQDSYVDVRVFNPRSNPLFPDFVGFDSTMVNAFYYFGGGCAFEAPILPGSKDRFKYSPQDEVK
jgi:hypothetical protein